MNRSRRRARHNYTNHKKCPGKMSFCSKQHVSNTWGSNHGEVKQHWGLAGKACIPTCTVTNSLISNYKWRFFDFTKCILKIQLKVLFSVALFRDICPEKQFYLGEQIFKQKMIRHFVAGIIMFSKTTDET